MRRLAKRAFRLLLIEAAAVSWIGAAAWVFLTPFPSVTVSGDQVASELRAAYPWVRPSGSDAESGGRTFHTVDSGDFRAPILALSGGGREQELDLFATDAEAFAAGPGGFREAQRRLASARSEGAPPPRLRSWGSLPYPPFRELPAALEGELGDFSPGGLKTSFVADGPLQAGLDRLTGTELTRNAEIALLEDGASLDPMLRLVLGAKRYVLVNMLSVACDQPTSRLLEAMEGRAAEGLDVRVVVNSSYAWLDLPCLKRLRSSGIAVAEGPTHSSYLLSDQSELIIGSQSLARMFLASTGYNGLDRDVMLRAKGPLATDALRDFITVWEDARSDEDKGSTALAVELGRRLAWERGSGVRGGALLAKGDPGGLCRFAAQGPDGSRTELSRLLLALVEGARERISFSGVRLAADNELVAALLRRANEDGLEVDFLGNGWEGGNGEATMVLEELAEAAALAGSPRLARLWDLLTIWDRSSQLERRNREYASVMPGIRPWKHFGFTHQKAWSFDRLGVWIGSANPTAAALRNHAESGVLCIDPGLARSFARARALDLANSVPVAAPAAGGERLGRRR